jgi:hypothetical protein
MNKLNPDREISLSGLRPILILTSTMLAYGTEVIDKNQVAAIPEIQAQIVIN